MANLLFSVPAFHAAYMQEFTSTDKLLTTMYHMHATKDYFFALDGHAMLVCDAITWHADKYGNCLSFRYTPEIIKALRSKKAKSLDVYYDKDRKRTEFVVEGVGQFPADEKSCTTNTGLIFNHIFPPDIKAFLARMNPKIGENSFPSLLLNPKTLGAIVKIGKVFQLDYGKTVTDPMLVTWHDVLGLRGFIMPYEKA